jgi:hypothetical protein
MDTHGPSASTAQTKPTFRNRQRRQAHCEYDSSSARAKRLARSPQTIGWQICPIQNGKRPESHTTPVSPASDRRVSTQDGARI